jgi:hypothetical protein
MPFPRKVQVLSGEGVDGPPGTAWMVDFKSLKGVHYFTVMELCSRVVRPLRVEAQSGACAISAMKSVLCTEIAPQLVLFDKAQAFVHTLDAWLTEPGRGIRTACSKGYHPEHVAALERFHKEMNRLAQADADFADKMDAFAGMFNNSDIPELPGVSRLQVLRSGSSLWQRVAKIRNERRLTRAANTYDEASLFSAGDRCLWRKTSEKYGTPATIVKEARPGVTLIRRDSDLLEFEVPTDDLKRIGSGLDLGRASGSILPPTVGKTVIYESAGKLYAGDVMHIDPTEGSLHIAELLPTKSTRRKALKDRVFEHVKNPAGELQVWIIPAQDALGCGDRVKGKLSPQLIDLWRREASRRVHMMFPDGDGRHTLPEDNVTLLA